MKIPGRKLFGKAEEAGNVVGVPMTRGLGLSELLKRTFEEAWKDQLDAFAGILTYKVLFALFPLSGLCTKSGGWTLEVVGRF